jgi:hypothetical protein
MAKQRSVSYKSAPEFANVTAFVQYLMDEERTTFTHAEVEALNYRTKTLVQKISAELRSYGFELVQRPVEKHIRGFTTSSNDRWFGPGSCKTYGSATYDSMMIEKYGKS